MDAWNKASIAKLAWAVALKKDNLWKKVCKIKDEFMWGSKPNQKWVWSTTEEGGYTIQSGYKWYLNNEVKCRWHKIILANTKCAKPYLHLLAASVEKIASCN